MQKSAATQTNPLSLFFTTPTQAMGPGNFTDYRIHTTSTLMTTASSMAEEQATEPMGDLGGGLEQDKTMGGPMAGVPEEAPRPMAPPLRVNTSTFRAGYKGLPWDRGNPSSAPLRDSKKSHIAKPNSFKDQKDFCKFNRGTYLYTTTNPGEFPTDKSKVMFYLSYMKEGLLGQFVENVVQAMMDWEALRLDPKPNFKIFMEKLTRTSGDVNKKVMAQEQLSRSFQGKMTAE
jgi:hypothetical protein